MFNAFKLCCLVFLLISCSSDEGPFIECSTDNTYTYLALGDSYTIGQSVSVVDRYPVQLSTRLNDAGIPIADPVIIAQTGWRTDDLQRAIEAENPTANYDLVSLLIGVNNQFQNIPIAIYEIEFLDLLQSAIRLAKGNKDRVFVCAIPDYAFTPYGAQTPNPQMISDEIDAYNLINKTISDSLGIAYFDITPISREGLNDKTLVATDGLHPSGEMYSLWVDLIFPSVMDYFN